MNLKRKKSGLEIGPLALHGEDNALQGYARSRLPPDSAVWLFAPRMALPRDILLPVYHTHGRPRLLQANHSRYQTRLPKSSYTMEKTYGDYKVD
jgi:hypothetical protein